MLNMYLPEVKEEVRRSKAVWTFIIHKHFMKRSQILTFPVRELPKEKASVSENLFLVSSETSDLGMS